MSTGREIVKWGVNAGPCNLCLGEVLALIFLKSPYAVDDRWNTELCLSVRHKLASRVTVAFIVPFMA